MTSGLIGLGRCA